MSDDQYITTRGVVTQARGNGNFLVKCNDFDHMISCTISGKIRRNSIKILENDEVSVDVSVYDTTKGRITYRFKSKR